MDGVDPPGTGHFAKRPSRFDETNPQSGSPLSSPPLSSSLSPLRCPAHPTVLRGPREMRQQHSGGQQCAGRGRAARRGRSPSLPSPTGGTGHGSGQAWPARLELAERRADLQPRGADRSRSRRRSRAPSAQASPALRASLASKICAPSEGPSLGSGRLQPPPPAPPTPLPIPRHNLKERNTRPPQSQVPHVALPSNPFKDQCGRCCRWGRAAGHADGRAAAGHGGGELARPPRALP